MQSEQGFRQRTWLIIIAAALMAIAAGVAFTWFFAIRETGPIPRKYTKGIRYKLYYPTRLPSGYSVNAGSFERKDDVLIFSINAPNGKNLAVAEQAVPANAPSHTTTTAPVSLPGEKNFRTAAGDAKVSLWGDKYVSDIITPTGTWIIINATGFTMDEAVTVAQSFAQL